MSAYAPSISFMLRHELRLHWRNLGLKMRAGLAAALILVGMHIFAWPIVLVFDQLPQFARAEVLLSVSVALLCGLLAMVSTSLIAVVKMVYERRDFDLLLSSPLDPHAIVVSRTLGIMASSVGPATLLVAPFANMFALMGNPQYLALYPAVISLGLLSVSTSLLLAEGLFRLVGARHTRIFAQVVGLVIASALIITVNLQYLVDNVSDKAHSILQAVAAGMPAVDSWIWLPARAVLGEALPLATLAVFAAGLFVLTTLGLANSFLRNANAAAGTAKVRTPGAGGAMRPFRGGAMKVMRSKELRLLARDPYLLAQVMYQVVAIVPIAFMMWKSSANWPGLVWLSLVMIAGIVASNLAWLAIAAEDSPDLLAVSPLSPRDVLRAKLEAALLPVGVLLALPIAVATVLNPWLGATLLLCCAGCAASTALLNLRYRKPTKRSEFNMRAYSNWRVLLMEYVIASVWAGIAALMLISVYFAALPLLFALAIACLFMRERRRFATA